MTSKTYARLIASAMPAVIVGGMLFSSCSGVFNMPGLSVDVDDESVFVDLPGVFVSVTEDRVLVDIPGFALDITGDIDLDIDWDD